MKYLLVLTLVSSNGWGVIFWTEGSLLFKWLCAGWLILSLISSILVLLELAHNTRVNVEVSYKGIERDVGVSQVVNLKRLPQ